MAKAVLQKEVELLLDKPRDGGPVGEGASPHRGAWHPLGARPPIFSPIPQRKFESSEKLENIPGTHNTRGQSSVAPVCASAQHGPHIASSAGPVGLGVRPRLLPCRGGVAWG